MHVMSFYQLEAADACVEAASEGCAQCDIWSLLSQALCGLEQPHVGAACLIPAAPQEHTPALVAAVVTALWWFVEPKPQTCRWCL